jgi:2-oxoglutarate dehydrogenase E2 component (dihydrolipoamide succinyltransferase)
VRALVDAIADFPLVNSHVGAEGLDVFAGVGLGVAVDVADVGLVVPVIRGADGLRLEALGARIREVSSRVRSGELSGHLLDGGTITITNPGPTGTVCGRPIINRPQAVIVETDAVRPQVVVDTSTAGSGPAVIAVRRRGNLSMSYDHRAFDGLYACSFLRRVVDIMSEREWTAELTVAGPTPAAAR